MIGDIIRWFSSLPEPVGDDTRGDDRDALPIPGVDETRGDDRDALPGVASSDADQFPCTAESVQMLSESQEGLKSSREGNEDSGSARIVSVLCSAIRGDTPESCEKLAARIQTLVTGAGKSQLSLLRKAAEAVRENKILICACSSRVLLKDITGSYNPQFLQAKNSVYFPTWTDVAESTVLHELTHVALVFHFKNGSLPFATGDSSEGDIYAPIREWGMMENDSDFSFGRNAKLVTELCGFQYPGDAISLLKEIRKLAVHLKEYALGERDSSSGKTNITEERSREIGSHFAEVLHLFDSEDLAWKVVEQLMPQTAGYFRNNTLFSSKE